MFPKVLVYGWYNHGNLGDDLFVAAFRYLFPTFNFIFTDRITSQNLQDVDAVFIGGGSLIGEPLNIANDLVFETLKQKKLFYIGIGTETVINPKHLELIKLAKLIATRTSKNLQSIQDINSNTIVIPDLVYCLESVLSDNKIDKSVLIIPNILVVPKWNDQHWKHTAWNNFKTEFSQFLDELVDLDYTINFLPLCVSNQLSDNHAAIEIINSMSKRSGTYLLDKQDDVQSVTKLLSKYSIVITQRYHGMILSDMAQTSCLTIHHHDKLKDSQCNLSYYGIYKAQLKEKLNQVINIKNNSILSIDRDIFEGLKLTITDLIR